MDSIVPLIWTTVYSMAIYALFITGIIFLYVVVMGMLKLCPSYRFGELSPLMSDMITFVTTIHLLRGAKNDPKQHERIELWVGKFTELRRAMDRFGIPLFSPPVTGHDYWIVQGMLLTHLDGFINKRDLEGARKENWTEAWHGFMATAGKLREENK